MLKVAFSKTLNKNVVFWKYTNFTLNQYNGQVVSRTLACLFLFLLDKVQYFVLAKFSSYSLLLFPNKKTEDNWELKFFRVSEFTLIEFKNNTTHCFYSMKYWRNWWHQYTTFLFSIELNTEEANWNAKGKCPHYPL